MSLPVMPPIEPMLAKLSRSLPQGDYLYEPKWDGFRCLIFRDGSSITLQSRNGRPLDRYFPELVDLERDDPLRTQLPDRVVLDGELVVPGPDGLDFDALSSRIHPAQTRVDELAARTPARFVAFDLLATGDTSLLGAAFLVRRAQLERLMADTAAPLHLTPATRDSERAADWFKRFEGAGLDGVIAKPRGDVYAPGRRTLLKIKHERTADVVVAGFRWHKDADGVGSLLLGLWDGDELVPVGVASSFSAARRSELIDELAAHRVSDAHAHPWSTESAPRGVNRWNSGRDTSWEPLDTTLVAEVSYEQMTGTRFRHSARFKRWRPDRDPASCRFDQLEAPVPAELADVLAAASDT